MSYYILAYYHFTTIDDPYDEVAKHKAFFVGRDATSRIYISSQGINGQMSAARADAEAYIQWMHSRPEFKDVVFKIDEYHENVFPRLTIKMRPNLVGYDKPVDLANRGEHVDPLKWKEMLEQTNGHVLIDVRNDYEWKVGHFENAELPACETFRDFDAYSDKLKELHDPKTTPVMMYCTGGIRCELYSSILKEKGFEKVYQLEGGVINYGKKAGNTHWLGKLFVFDDRLAVSISDEEAPIIGKCHHCQKPTENYYNCANMDCNELFLCCDECLQPNVGCCQKSCQSSSRLRPFQQLHPHKPFKRWYQYFNPGLRN